MEKRGFFFFWVFCCCCCLFFCRTQGMWKLGWNLCHSCSNAGSSTHYITRKLLVQFFKKQDFYGVSAVLQWVKGSSIATAAAISPWLWNFHMLWKWPLKKTKNKKQKKTFFLEQFRFTAKLSSHIHTLFPYTLPLLLIS